MKPKRIMAQSALVLTMAQATLPLTTALASENDSSESPSDAIAAAIAEDQGVEATPSETPESDELYETVTDDRTDSLKNKVNDEETSDGTASLANGFANISPLLGDTQGGDTLAETKEKEKEKVSTEDAKAKASKTPNESDAESDDESDDESKAHDKVLETAVLKVLKHELSVSFADDLYFTDSDYKALDKALEEAETQEDLDQITKDFTKRSEQRQKEVREAYAKALKVLDGLNTFSDEEKESIKAELEQVYDVDLINEIINTAKHQDLENQINAKRQTEKEAERRAKERQYAEQLRLISQQRAEQARRAEQRALQPAYTGSSQASYSGQVTQNNHSLDEIRYTANQTTAMFVHKIAEDAREIAGKNDLYASVMIAQAILESGSGNSDLAKAPNNNLFGIKGTYKGKSVTLGTQEDDGSGNLYNINGTFRKYPSHKESLEDYVELMKQDFYKGAHKSKTKNYHEATKFLTGRYATDTSYYKKLDGLIKTYRLEQYDHKKSDIKAIEKVAGKHSKKDQKRIQKIAETQLGVPYVFGGSIPGVGLDCSGFVQYVYSQMGIQLPRTAQQQWEYATPIPEEAAQKGDLIFFKNTYPTSDFITHVAIYMGNGTFIEEGGRNVHYTSLYDDYAQQHFVGFGRVVK